MGNRSTKSSLRNAIIHLNISADSVKLEDSSFWSQILNEDLYTASELIKAISIQEIRMLRDGSPKNFASLAYKMAEHLCLATRTLCNTYSQQTAVIIAARILTRILPCMFENKDWSNFFEVNDLELNEFGKSVKLSLVFPEKRDNERDFTQYLPSNIQHKLKQDNTPEEVNNEQQRLLKNDKEELSTFLSDCKESKSLPKNGDDFSSKRLSYNLVLSICDLLFCPEFTVNPHTEKYLNRVVDAPPEDIRSLSTCDYVWEPGVGFDSYANSTTSYDKNRSELLRLLLVCLSSYLYDTPEESCIAKNYWLETFSSSENRHALPLFTSLLNTIFIYKPAKLLPFNYLLFEDKREELVELCLQVLICTLDSQPTTKGTASKSGDGNMFIEYTTRIHRNEDFSFLVQGFARLLNNNLGEGSLINYARRINFEQELLILLWRMCNLNGKFINYVMTAKEILELTVPILYHLNENFRDSTKTTLIHTGIFNLLILSGERNFGVVLNRPYSSNYLTNLPPFAGSHADLVILVFHKLILYGQNFEQMIDFLMTIIVNISPYLKTITALASRCLIQLFEIFTSPYVIFTEPNYHKVIVFLLEIFNNLIQYQFDGNASLVYVILDRKDAFHSLANLACNEQAIQKVLKKLMKKKKRYTEFDKLNLNQNNLNISASVEPKKSLENIDRSGIDNNKISQCLNQEIPKHEVALAALPNISSITQTIHPFGLKKAPQFEEKVVGEVKNPVSSDSLNQKVKSLLLDQESSPTKNQEDRVVAVSEQQISLIDDDTIIIERKVASPDQESKIEQTNTSDSLEVSSDWKPTPDWMKEWKLSLPLHTTLRMIEVLEPQIERIRQNNSNESEIINFLQNGTLVGLLPVPHPIQIRKYRINEETILWFRCCSWAIVYSRSTIWTNTLIKLLKII